uniref:Uncharacterized protein n=1 Tax=Arundo donax TaxID=35708 RepID=A0A0A9HR23_ARUDO
MKSSIIFYYPVKGSHICGVCFVA